MRTHARLRFLLFVTVLAIGVGPATQATICVVPESGGSTQMPPPVGTPNCTEGYVSPTDFHMIVDGLPPGTTIQVGAEHNRFININNSPGGNLGGERETFESSVDLVLTGTGDLAGFSRTLTIPLSCVTDIGPRTPGDAVQDFDNDMFQLQGAIFGDPDFDVLQITGGTSFGLPSPGHTTLTRLGPPGSDFNVDSFFDITYEISFQGAPGSQLDGASGTTQATVRMGLGQPVAATPAAGGPGLLIALFALALLIPVALFLRRARTA